MIYGFTIRLPEMNRMSLAARQFVSTRITVRTFGQNSDVVFTRCYLKSEDNNCCQIIARTPLLIFNKDRKDYCKIIDFSDGYAFDEAVLRSV